MWDPNHNPYHGSPNFRRPMALNLRQQSPLLGNNWCDNGPRQPIFPHDSRPGRFMQQPNWPSARRFSVQDLPLRNHSPNHGGPERHMSPGPKVRHFPPIRCSSPVFPSPPDNYQKPVIPFIGDSDDSRCGWDMKDNERNRFIPSFERSGYHHAGTSSNVFNVSNSQPRRNIPLLCEDGISDSKDNDLYEPKVGPVEAAKHVARTSFEEPHDQVSEPDVPSDVTSNSQNVCNTSLSSADNSKEPLPFNISHVLGDPKMLNDILSVAKTIQFSEQSKSLTFPTCTSAVKSVAIVPPINVQSDSTCRASTAVSVVSSAASNATNFSGSLSDSIPLLGDWPRTWPNNSNHGPAAMYPCPPAGNPSCKQTESSSDDSMDGDDMTMRFKYASANQARPSPEPPGVPLSYSFQNSASSGRFYSPASSTKSPSCEDSMLEGRINLKRMATEDPVLPAAATVTDPKRARLEISAIDVDATAVSTPSSTTDIGDLGNLTPAVSEAGDRTDEDIKSELFENLARFLITTDDDANVVLKIISVLTEAYLKYKLRFVPQAKFQSLIKSILEGKEKETNFVLSFLRCGATENSAYSEYQDGNYSPDTEAKTSGPEKTRADQANVLSASLPPPPLPGSSDSAATSSNLSQSPSGSVYSPDSGASALSCYWTPRPTGAADPARASGKARAVPARPLLPPPLPPCASMQPPLPPPPMLSIRPPLPRTPQPPLISDVPLPPPPPFPQ